MATHRFRRTTAPPTAPSPSDRADALVRDHHRAIEAAKRDFESWQSSAIVADSVAVDEIRAALRAMLLRT